MLGCKPANTLLAIADRTIATSRECELAEVDGRSLIVGLRDGLARVLTRFL